MLSPQDGVTAGFLDMVVSEAEFVARVQPIAQVMTKPVMKADLQAKLKARAELLQVFDECIKKDRHSNL